MHLRVAPGDFTRIYNAAQLATGPALAACRSSPTFLGRRLWEETRVALFKQSVEDRDSAGLRRGPARAGFGTGWLRGGALELFTESVRQHEPLLPFVSDAAPDGTPGLAELRLHQEHGLALEPGHPTTPRIRGPPCGSRCAPCPPGRR